MSGSAKLYSLSLSHPGHAARLMLERKGVEHRVVNCLPGTQPLVVRAAGFRRWTVPALKLDGRRVQGSLQIARFLDELKPEPRLLPLDSKLRAAVEEAERWGERELQPVPRRLFRWGVANCREMRRWMAGEVAGMPAPRVMGELNAPVARLFARASKASGAQVRADLVALPGQLDHVDSLIAEGTLGAGEPNAADFQIGTTVRVFLAFEDLRHVVEGRPSADLARRILPDYPEPVPPFLPPDWV